MSDNYYRVEVKVIEVGTEEEVDSLDLAHGLDLEDALQLMADIEEWEQENG